MILSTWLLETWIGNYNHIMFWICFLIFLAVLCVFGFKVRKKSYSNMTPSSQKRKLCLLERFGIMYVLFLPFVCKSSQPSNFFWYPHQNYVKKIFWGHISTFCKLLSQKQAKRLKKKPVIFVAYYVTKISNQINMGIKKIHNFMLIQKLLKWV